MRSSRNLVVSFLVLSLSFSLLPSAFARKGREKKQEQRQEESRKQEQKPGGEAFVKLLLDAAGALRGSNYELSREMVIFAKEEEKGIKDPARRETHVELLKAAANALQTSNPELAANLMEIAAER